MGCWVWDGEDGAGADPRLFCKSDMHFLQFYYDDNLFSYFLGGGATPVLSLIFILLGSVFGVVVCLLGFPTLVDWFVF